jgi:hypothetical protein
VPDGTQEPCLADTRLTGEEQELTTSGGNLVEAPIREVEQVVAADQQGAANGSERGGHRLRSV